MVDLSEWRRFLYRTHIGRFEDGTISMEASYKDGLPHGQQLRRFPDGSPALEAIFDNGILWN